MILFKQSYFYKINFLNIIKKNIFDSMFYDLFIDIMNYYKFWIIRK